LFLLPMVVVAAALGYALKLATKVSKPVIDPLPEAWLGTGTITIVAAILITFVSLSAGLFAHTQTGKGIMDWLENSMLCGLPVQQFCKTAYERRS